MREELTPLKLSQWNYYTRTLRDNVKKFNINPADLDRNAPIVVNGVRYNTGQDYTNAVLRETIPQKEGNLTIGDISSVQRLFNTMVNSAFENNDQQFIDSHLKYVVRDLGMGPGRLSAEDGRVGSLTMNYNFPVNAAVAGASGTTVKTPFESEKNPPMEFYFPKSMQSYDNLKFEPFQMKRAGGVTQDITRLKLEKGGRMDGSIEVENGGSAKKIGSNPDEKKIQGRSHAKGGVDVTHKSGKKYELEGGEVVDGDRVFSAKLQNSEGVTFAAAAEDLLKAKKKAEMALRVASVHTKDKIRKKVREIESSLTALFEEQQAMNGDSTGEYAQEGTDMGGTPVAGSPTGGGPGNPISSLYNTLQGTRLKDLFISEGDLLTSLNKDPQGVVNAIRSDQDAFNKIAPVFTQSFPDLAKQIGISPGIMEDVSKKKVQQDQVVTEAVPGAPTYEAVVTDEQVRPTQFQRVVQGVRFDTAQQEADFIEKRASEIGLDNKILRRALAGEDLTESEIKEAGVTERPDAIITDTYQTNMYPGASGDVKYNGKAIAETILKNQGFNQDAIDILTNKYSTLYDKERALGLKSDFISQAKAAGVDINQEYGKSAILKGLEYLSDSDKEIARLEAQRQAAVKSGDYDKYLKISSEIKKIKPTGEFYDPLTGRFTDRPDEESAQFTDEVMTESQNLAKTDKQKLIKMWDDSYWEMESAERNYNRLVESNSATGVALENASSKLREQRKQFLAINRALLTNTNFEDTEKGFKLGEFVSNMGQSFMESLPFGVGKEVDLDTKLSNVGGVVNQFVESGVEVPKGLIERAKPKFVDLAASTIGTSIGIGTEIALNAIISKRVGVDKALSSLVKATSNRYGKGAGIFTRILSESIKDGVIYELSGAGFATGVGEGLAQETLGKWLTKTLGSKGSRLADFFLKRGAGFTGEFAGEYAGQLAEAFVDKGFNVNQVFKQTFGENFDEAKHNAALIALTVLPFSLIGGTAVENQDAVNSAIALNERLKKDLQANPGDQAIDSALKMTEDFIDHAKKQETIKTEKYATETTKEPVQEGVQPSGISEYQGAEGRQPQEGEGERRIGQAEVGQADRGDRIVGRQEVQEKVDNLPATGEVLRTESVSVPTEKTGTFINVGLKVGKTDELLTEEEIKSKLPEGVEMIQATRVEPDSGLVSEPTMSIELSRPLTDSEMSKLLEDTQQLAIPQMSGTTGVMYGTTDWGPFNGYYFVTPDGNRVLATDPTMPDLQGRDFTSENADELATISENVPEGVGRKIVRDMGNVLKALSNIGGVSGTIHTTEEAYLDVLRKDGYTEEEISEAKGSSGFYEDRSGRIHINLPFVQSNTVFHEGAHPVLNAIFAQSPKAVDRLHGQLVKLAKRDKNVADVISWSKQYTGDRTIKNEAVTEFVARVADGQIDIKKSKSLLSLAKDIINEFLSILGSTRVVSNTNEIIEVAKQISESFKEGRAIELEKLKVRGVKAKPKAEAAPEVKGVPLEQKPQATQVEDVKEFIDTNDTPQPIEKGGVQMQVPAYQGSPYKFNKEILVSYPDGKTEYLVGTPDEFPKVPTGATVVKEFPNGRMRTDKIGTGEGAQAFGWGLYLADLESIARGYANKLGGYDNSVEKLNTTEGAKAMILGALDSNNGSLQKSKIYLENLLTDINKKIDKYNKGELRYSGEKWFEESILKEKDDIENAIKNIDNVTKQRILYKVTLHKGKTPEQYTWLEWDKPVSNKILTEISKKLKESGNELVDERIEENKIKEQGKLDPSERGGNITGARLYKLISEMERGDKQASLFLLENGIDGIKYPAESISRGATSDTARGFNYVVFDENAVTIDERVQFQKPKKGETLVPKSYKIDTDGKGNFLFYHYGEIKGDNIDPKYFGKNRYTSDKRSNAVSYFYTRSNEQESMVGGPVNIVKVPIEKVYPFNADPLNLVDEAEANFRKDSPTGAFDAVKQIDYMNPLIRREGFDMMVAKWSEFPLRAETTKALPIDKTLTRKMRDFGGLKVKDMLDKFSTDIANKLSDIANTIGPKQEKVRDRFYKLGGSRASTAKLMKDPVLRAAVGKTMFEKWNNLQPEEKKIQFQKPAEKQETYTDPLGNEKPMWTVKGGFTIREVDHLGDRIFVIERYGTMWGVAETLSQAERQISDRVLFQLPDKKFGETINRVYNAGNEIEKMIIDGSSDFDFTPQNHRFANDIADNILADAVANNNLMETLEGLRRTAEGSKNIGAATKIFTLLKIRDHAIKFGLTDVLKETLAQLDGISSYAARTLRALVTTAIPESIEYGATSRVRKVRDRMLKGNPKTAEAFKKISQKFPGLIESIGESIDEMTSEDAIVKLIDKAIQDGNVMPILKAAMADAKGKSQEEIDQIMADLEAEIESLNNQISTISQQLAASTIQNARANNQPATAPNTPASPQNRSPRNIPTPQQFTSLEKLAIAAYKLGYVNEQAFADKIRYEAYKAGLFLTDIEIKTLYDSTRQNIDIVELLAKGKRGLPKGQEMASSAVNTMIRTVLRKNIQAIAKSHFSTVGKLTSSLSSTIQAVFGTGPDAQAIATKIQEKFNEKVRTTATNFIAKNILSSKIPESSRIKEAQAISKKMLDRINAAVNAGVFDEQSFLDAFAEAYGFTSLTMEDRMNLKDYAYVLEYLPAESLERKKFFALFENYITRKERENAPLSTVAALWLETRYINMLGQFSTILRANKGLIFTSIAEAGVEIIMQLGKKGGLRSIAGAFSDALRATRDQGFDSLKQYIRDGVGQTTKFEPISIGQLQEIYNRGMSSDEKFGFFAELFGKGKKRTLFGKAVRGTGNVYHYLPAMFTRLIGVGDALGKPALKAFYARIAAHNALLREGLDPTDQKFFDRLTQLLKRDEGDIRLAKDAAERELQMMQDPLIADKMKKLGLKPSKNFVRNRTYEILDSQRESYIEEYSESMQARSRLMGKPYGKAGAAYDWIANGVRKFPALSVFVPFLRVPSNAMVEWYRWSPIGLLDVSVRQIPSVKMKKEIGRIIPKPVEALSETERMIEEREDLRDAIKGALGTVLALAPMFYAASLDPDDEDESYANLAFKVTGGGPAGLTFAEIQQLEELGLYRRNSIRFKTKGFDTGWIDYRDMPFAWVLSSSGFVMDRKYFGTSEKKKEFISKNEWIQATEGVASSAFFFKEQSYLSGLLQLGDIMGGSRSNYDGPQLEASASSGGKFLIDLLRTSVYPGLYRQSYVMAKPYLPEEYGVVYRPYKFSDEGVPMSTVILQELAKDVPYFEQFIGRRAYDIWGQDVEVTVTKNPLMDAIVSNILWKVFLPNTPAEYLDAGFKKKMDDPVNSYFNKRGIPLPVISNLSGVDASVNDKYKRKVGQELYKMLKPDIESKKVAKPLAGGEVPGLGSVDEDGKYKMSVKSAEIKINELLKLAKEKAKAQMPELKEVSEDDRVASYIEQITGVQFGTTPTGRTKAKSTKPKSPTKSKKQK